MICLIALVVFSILGIFSVRYRKIAAEAFDCVFRRVTLRPCTSGLDRRLKNRVVAAVSRKNVKLARFVVKRFEILSWFFTILLFLSLFFSIRGVYFYVVYGNCNGENSNGFCVFDALNPGDDASVCQDTSLINENKSFVMPVSGNDPYIGKRDAKVTVIEFGCFSCPYTREAEPVVKQIIKEYGDKILFVYKDFPLPTHDNSRLAAKAAYCAKDNYWAYHDLLFEHQGEFSFENMVNLAESIGISDFGGCLNSEEAENEVQKDFEEGINANIYGTPTFFINDVVVVGPKPYRYLKNIIDNELR